MTFAALALVLVSACMHAGWNLAAKRAGGGVVFTWLFASLTAVLYAPLGFAYAYWQGIRLGTLDLVFIAGSSLIHIAYFLALQRGYRVGDLSLVYPLARGSGPMLATVGAILLLGERPSPLALAGTVLIVSCVFLLTGGQFKPGQRRAVAYGLVTGLFIATYTLWDGYAVSRVGTAPLIYTWLSESLRTLWLAPFVLRDRARLRLEWQRHRREAFIIAIFSPLAYIMVLTALTFTPVSYVAPAREISILVGALLGARLLAEGDTRRRLLAAGGMVLGVICLALG